MGTRAIIARPYADGFMGRFHFSSGYPHGLGATLYQLYNGYFNQDIKHMLRVLLDEHVGGWSNIIDSDFSLPSRWDNPYGRDYTSSDNHPVCYCHGDRQETDGLYTSEMSTDTVWLYVLNEKTQHMYIHIHAGYENDDYVEGRDIWRCVADVDLNAVAPNWKEIAEEK